MTNSAMPISSPHRRVRFLLPLAAALLMIAAAGPVSADADVPTVENGADPAGGETVLRLEEIWRAGGLDDEENLFGVIAQVLVDPENRLLLLDGQLSQVHVFTPEGEALDPLSRQGEGPGEVTRPNDMFLLPDGSLGLLQIFPGRIVKVNLDGSPAGTFDYDTGGGEGAAGGAGFAVLVQGMRKGDDLLLCGMNQAFAQGMLTQNRFLYSFNPDGTRKSVFAESSVTVDFARPEIDEVASDFCWGRFAQAPDGRVALAPARDAYSIEIRGSDGALQRVVTRTYEHRDRDELDMSRTRATYEAQGRFYPVPPAISISDFDPDVMGMFFMDDELWVLPSQGRRVQAEGVMLAYDVFDREGRYARRVAMSCPGDGVADALFPAGEGRWVLVRNQLSAALSSMGAESAGETEEPEPMEIIVYREAD